MSQFFKQLFIIILILLTGTSFIFGAVLPYRKAKAFVSAMREIKSSSSMSIQRLEEIMDYAFSLSSPVGEEEYAKFFASEVVMMLEGEFPEEVKRRLVGYAEEKIRPVLEREPNSVYPQLLLSLGLMYERLWDSYGNDEDLSRAIGYYERGNAIAVDKNRPQFLWSLRNTYLKEGNIEKARETMEHILSIWPDDKKTREMYDKLEELLRKAENGI